MHFKLDMFANGEYKLRFNAVYTMLANVAYCFVCSNQNLLHLEFLVLMRQF